MSSPIEIAQPAQREETRTEREGVIRCRNCSHTITRSKAAMEAAGRHEHTFRNPAGYSFHILCYSEAPGCTFSGFPSSEATWFPGYAWNFATCGGCGAHLGWRYLGPSSFVGLIATRLLRPDHAVG